MSRPDLHPRTRWLLCGLVMLPVLAGGCGGGDEEPAAPAGSGPRLEQVFTDQKMVETDNGKKKWILQSSQMQQFSGRSEVLLIDLTMDFYREGDVFSTLTADSGRADPDSHDIHAWGNVVVVTRDGRRLETDELFYDNKTQLITNDVFDHYYWSDGEATGIGMEASPDLEYFEIKRSFNSEIQDEDTTGDGGR